ncbi:MAG: hypothetical protein U5L09_12980 [Bacteroidales bacterium]|nr:hypothetical protein [Bacteroidales bacterium]
MDQLIKQKKSLQIIKTPLFSKLPLPFHIYEEKVKLYMANEFGNNTWAIISEINELFDFPLSEYISLSYLINYLNKNNYTGLLANKLDMHADIDLVNPSFSFNSKNYLELMKYYSVDFITEYCDDQGNGCKIKKMRGGIKQEIFNIEDNDLSSVPFINTSKVKAINNSKHHENINLADITGVIFSYEFTPDFKEKVVHSSHDFYPDVAHLANYQKYYDKMRLFSHLNLKNSSSSEFENTTKLIERNFIHITSKFMLFIIDKVLENQEYHNWHNDETVGILNRIQFSQMEKLSIFASNSKQAISHENTNEYTEKKKLSGSNTVSPSRKFENNKRSQNLYRNNLNDNKELEAILNSYSWRIGKSITTSLKWLFGWLPIKKTNP